MRVLRVAAVAAAMASLVSMAAAQETTDPWLESLRGAAGTVIGDLTPRFGESEGAGGDERQPVGESGEEAGAPGGAAGVNPADPNVAGLIREWIDTAEPPPNATEGASFRYTYRGNMVGTTADGGIIKSPHETGAFDPVFLWVNRRALDSVDHCTMEEYVLARSGDESIAWCRGRYTRSPAVAGAPTAEQAARDEKAATELVGPWRFGRVGGPFLCDLTLTGESGAHGRVIRACHGNESFWRLERGELVFLDNAGRLTSRLSRRDVNNWEGPYLLEPERHITHYIRRALRPDEMADADRRCKSAYGAAAYPYVDDAGVLRCDCGEGHEWNTERTGCVQSTVAQESEEAEPGELGAGELEPGVDRMGGDYRSFWLPSPEPGLCKAACDREAACRAWTYVIPGHQGKDARCWLKSSVPAPRRSACCTSGVKAAPTAAVEGGKSYFVGTWSLNATACRGQAPQRKPDRAGSPATVGDAIVEGIEEGIEQVIARLGFEFLADGSFDIVNLSTGEREAGGRWSDERGVLTTRFNDPSMDGGDARVLERRPDRATFKDMKTGDEFTLWRCGGSPN